MPDGVLVVDAGPPVAFSGHPGRPSCDELSSKLRRPGAGRAGAAAPPGAPA